MLRADEMIRSVRRNRDRSSQVLKALAVLAHVARRPEPVGLAELSAAARLPKPTARRLAGVLEQAGLVQKDSFTRRYGVGPGLLDLAFDALRSRPAHRNRQLLLERLSEKLGETVNLGALSGNEVIYLDRVVAYVHKGRRVRRDKLALPSGCPARRRVSRPVAGTEPGVWPGNRLGEA